MTITGKKAVQCLGCGAFCLIILVMAFWNRTLIMEPFMTFLRGEYRFEDMKSEVQENYLDDRFRGKFDLITLNGGYARLTGRTSYNEVQMLNNGMIIMPATERTDTADFVNRVSRYHQYLEKQGIPFLLVFPPFKVPTEENLLPVGAVDLTNEITDRALLELTERGVPVLDLREEMSRTIDQVERYFYRTDHHWNVDGSFLAYQRIMEAIQDILPETKMNCTDQALWEKTTVPNFWMGGDGRRVGPLFAGTDDLDYYLPGFETRMARYSLGVWTCKGDFREANIREWMLEHSDLFHMDTYSRYLGGSYAHTLHYNAGAENQMKLGIIKDSFTRPVECFLSTEFTAVDAIDPRLFRGGAMNEVDYFTLNPPDMVLMIIFPQILPSTYFSSYLLPEGKEMEVTEETMWGDLTVAGTAGNADYQVLPAVLESGKDYVLTAEDIQVHAGEPDGANVVLCQGDILVDQTIFEIEYGNRFGIRWGFHVPESTETTGAYQLRFYAGVDGATEGMELTYGGIRLQECALK